MALSTVPFALQNSAHSADVFREAVSSLLPNGGGLVQGGDLAVTQTGTPSMAVQIGTGRAWIKGTEAGDLAGQTYGKQGLYFALNDAAVTKTVTTANATNPRIDVACIAVKDQQYSGAVNNVDFYIVAGTPAASPVAPAIPSNAVALANIAVAANATSITNANITTLNPNTQLKMRHAEWGRTNQSDAPANTMWGPGMFSVLFNATESVNSGFITGTGAGNDQFKILEDGIYSFTWLLRNQGGTCSYWLKLSNTANSYDWGKTPTTSLSVSDVLTLAIPNMRLRAGDLLQVRYVCTAPTVPVDHFFKMTKVQ